MTMRHEKSTVILYRDGSVYACDEKTGRCESFSNVAELLDLARAGRDGAKEFTQPGHVVGNYSITTDKTTPWNEVGELHRQLELVRQNLSAACARIAALETPSAPSLYTRIERVEHSTATHSAMCAELFNRVKELGGVLHAMFAAMKGAFQPQNNGQTKGESK